MRPGQQSEAAQRQHANLCKLIKAKVVTLYTILFGVGGTCYTEHTLNQFKGYKGYKGGWPTARESG
eukprot:1139513-Pelagomonas_calceolata.AAC.2